MPDVVIGQDGAVAAKACVGHAEVIGDARRETLDVRAEIVAEVTHGAADEGRRAGRRVQADLSEEGTQRLERIALPAVLAPAAGER